MVGAIICRIVLLDRAMAAHDPTRDTWPANIATQLVQCLSIVTASVPQLIPFLRNLNSSGMDLAGITRHMATSHPKSTKSSRAGKTYIWSPSGRSRSGKGSSGYELDYVRRPKNKAVVTNVSKGDNDGESQSSQVGIIRETVSWTVTEERRNSLDRGRGDGEGNNGGHGLW